MICLTVGFYGLSRALGVDGARRELARQLKGPDETSLPVVRTIARLRELADVRFSCDLNGSNASKMRARSAYTALTSGCDLWISCDDDVEADAETLQSLIEAVEGDEPSICIAPCLMRGGELVNVDCELGTFIEARHLPSGADAVPCLGGGFGLVAMNHAALERVIDAHPDLVFVDDDGHTKSALFHEELVGGRWWGEDLSFFRRVPHGVRVECLMTGHTIHDGHVLDFASLPDRPRLKLGWERPADKQVMPERLPEVVDVPAAEVEILAKAPADDPEPPPDGAIAADFGD